VPLVLLRRSPLRRRPLRRRPLRARDSREAKVGLFMLLYLREEATGAFHFRQVAHCRKLPVSFYKTPVFHQLTYLVSTYQVPRSLLVKEKEGEGNLIDLDEALSFPKP
jgi:hypothetical protein